MKETQFGCKVCGQNHSIETFIDLPKPIVIDKIIRGELREDLKIIAKDVYLVNKDKIIIRCLMKLDITDDIDNDTFDISFWAKVMRSNFLETFDGTHLNKNHVILVGEIDQMIPYYSDLSTSMVFIRVSIVEDDSPLIIGVKNKSSKLQKDIISGITTSKVIEILESVIHP